MMDNDVKNIIHKLVLKSLDGELLESESSLLNNYLTDSDNLEYYLKCLRLVDAVRSKAYYFEIHDNISNVITYEELEKLAFREATYPSVEKRDEKSGNNADLMSEVETKPHKPNKILKTFDKIVYLAAALMIVFIIYAELFSPESSMPVAKVIDQLGVKWSKGSDRLENNATLLTNQLPYKLKEGIIRIKYDQGVDVVIEGPSEFSIERNGIYLESGRLYSLVSKGGRGFTVDTPNSRFVDLGTEFGVDVTDIGISELHVLKGDVQLYAGMKGQDKTSCTVREGNAKRFDANSGILENISLKEKTFVRDFDPENQIIWRQQPSLDIADIAGGGNGFGTGKSNVMIHPKYGFVDFLTVSFDTANEYKVLPDSAYIDGVFVPRGQGETISSSGDVFAECPKTSGFFDNQVIVNPKPELYKTNLRSGTIRFNNKIYGQGGLPCIVMHSNLGLTIDLDEIRRNNTRSIDSFFCRVGIADLNENIEAKADFWVLVDGEVRYLLEKYSEKGVLNEVAIAIDDTDRYLTLVATDGGDTDKPDGNFYQRAISCDWCVFTEPILLFK